MSLWNQWKASHRFWCNRVGSLLHTQKPRHPLKASHFFQAKSQRNHYRLNYPKHEWWPSNLGCSATGNGDICTRAAQGMVRWGAFPPGVPVLWHSVSLCSSPFSVRREPRGMGSTWSPVSRDTAPGLGEVWKFLLTASLAVSSLTILCESNCLKTQALWAMQKHHRQSGSCEILLWIFMLLYLNKHVCKCCLVNVPQVNIP